MASTKSLLFLGLLLALVLLVSSQVGAQKESKVIGDVEAAQYRGGGYPGNGGGGGYPGNGGGGRRNGYPWRGCRYGCCRGYRNGPGCARCCATAHEVPEV